jgi:hypothetical protein
LSCGVGGAVADGKFVGIQWKLPGNAFDQAAGFVRSGQPGDGPDQRPVVLHWFRHPVIQTLCVMALDPAAPKRNPPRDQDARARVPVIVSEKALRYADRKPWSPRQQCQPHFQFHLILRSISKLVIEVSRELHEQVGVQAGRGFIVHDRQKQLTARAAARALLELSDSGDSVVRCERTGSLESRCEERLSPRTQGFAVRRYLQAQRVSEDPIGLNGSGAPAFEVEHLPPVGAVRRPIVQQFPARFEGIRAVASSFNFAISGPIAKAVAKPMWNGGGLHPAHYHGHRDVAERLSGPGFEQEIAFAAVPFPAGGEDFKGSSREGYEVRLIRHRPLGR